MISIRDLSHAFGDRQVLRDIVLDVAENEIVALMGSSGGGKTTLLRCISGLIAPTSGTVTVDGINVQEEPELARAKMGMVFQSAALFDSMNVLDNVIFGLRRIEHLRAKKAVGKARAALESVGLEGTERLMPAELSGGMRKRVGIARAIALGPKIMLFDEPTTGLDPVTTYSIDSLIRTLREKKGITAVVVSHDVTSVVRSADRIAFLDQGELTFVGPPSEFLKVKGGPIAELIDRSQIQAPAN